MSQSKILFIDRDGTLIAEPEDFQVDRFEKFVLEPDCIAALQKLRDAGWEFIFPVVLPPVMGKKAHFLVQPTLNPAQHTS